MLERYLRAVGLEDVEAARRMTEAWKASVPPTVVGGTRLIRARDGVLQVAVNSSALLFELKAFRRLEILRRLREQDVGYVRDLQFRLEAPDGGARAPGP